MVLSRKKKKIIGLLGLYFYYKNKRVRKCWVSEVLKKRRLDSEFFRLVPQLIKNNELKQYIRMDYEDFKFILFRISPYFRKSNNPVRGPISLNEKLMITLRYLATGNSYKSLQFSFYVHKSTICKFVPVICKVIIKALADYLKCPNTQEEWRKIQDGFKNRWNFPYCVGAMDGRHIAIKDPPHSGTAYFNYKKFYSVIFFAIVDYDYNFIHAECGSNGAVSDGAVWFNSEFNSDINDLNLPEDALFLGDGAFPLCKRILTPFQGRCNIYEAIFNYRLSRARRVVENAFGILTSKFRVLLKTIDLKVDYTNLVVLACATLHNVLRKRMRSNYLDDLDIENSNNGEVANASWRVALNSYLESSNLEPINRFDNSGRELRNRLCNFFNHEDILDWQNRVRERLIELYGE